MKFAAAVLALAVAVRAQSITACPAANGCVEDGMKSTGICTPGDWYCGCKNMDALQGAIAPCVLAKCSDSAVAVLTEVQTLCAQVLANPPKPSEAPPATEAPKPTGSEPPKASEPATTLTTAAPGGGCTKCNGTAPPKPTYATAGAAGQAAPLAGLVLGLAALAL